MNVSKNFLLRRTAEHRSNCSVQWWLLSQFPKHTFNISFWDKRANTVMRSHFGWCYTTAWFSGETFECSFPSCFHLPWKPLTLSGHTQICHRNQWIEQSCPRKRLFLLGQFFGCIGWPCLFACLFLVGFLFVCLFLSLAFLFFPRLSRKLGIEGEMIGVILQFGFWLGLQNWASDLFHIQYGNSVTVTPRGCH